MLRYLVHNCYWRKPTGFANVYLSGVVVTCPSSVVIVEGYELLITTTVDRDLTVVAVNAVNTCSMGENSSIVGFVVLFVFDFQL